MTSAADGASRADWWDIPDEVLREALRAWKMLPPEEEYRIDPRFLVTPDWLDEWGPPAMQPVAPKKSQHGGPNPPTNMAHTDEALDKGPPDELDYWSPDVKYALDYEVYHRPSRMPLDVLEANKLEGWVTQSWTDIEGITRVEKVQADFVIRRKR